MALSLATLRPLARAIADGGATFGWNGSGWDAGATTVFASTFDGSFWGDGTDISNVVAVGINDQLGHEFHWDDTTNSWLTENAISAGAFYGDGSGLTSVNAHYSDELSFGGCSLYAFEGIYWYSNVGISATEFYGDGSHLTGIVASNVVDDDGTLSVQGATRQLWDAGVNIIADWSSGGWCDSGGAAYSSAHGDSLGLAFGLYAHADSGGTAWGQSAHADSGGYAYGFNSSASASGEAYADYSHAHGEGASARVKAQHAESSGLNVYGGRPQATRTMLSGITEGIGIPSVQLTVPGSAEYYALGDAESVAALRITIVATETGAGNVSVWRRQCGISSNPANTGTGIGMVGLESIGTDIVSSHGGTGFPDISINFNGQLLIECTGVIDAPSPIHWTAYVEALEISVPIPV